jgi:hypothetical protein
VVDVFFGAGLDDVVTTTVVLEVVVVVVPRAVVGVVVFWTEVLSLAVAVVIDV